MGRRPPYRRDSIHETHYFTSSRTLDASHNGWAHQFASGGLACSEAPAIHSETLPRGHRGLRSRPEDTRGPVTEDSKTIPDARMVT